MTDTDDTQILCECTSHSRESITSEISNSHSTSSTAHGLCIQALQSNVESTYDPTVHQEDVPDCSLFPCGRTADSTVRVPCIQCLPPTPESVSMHHQDGSGRRLSAVDAVGEMNIHPISSNTESKYNSALSEETIPNQAYLTLAEAIQLTNDRSTDPPVSPSDTSNEPVCLRASAVDDRADDTSRPVAGLMPAETADMLEDDFSFVVPPEVNWLHPSPRLIAQAEKDYAGSKHYSPSENYLRGCLWSPDGSCILTNSRDNKLRLFNLPNCLLHPESVTEDSGLEEMAAVLLMQENELVYDYAWYPGMNSADPATCCFASSVRRNPIRLWDAFSGTVRATYLPIGHLGDPISAYSIGFSSDGQRLYAGFNRFIHVFDVCRPGRDSLRRPKLGKKCIQGGIVSCFAVPQDPSRHLYATGSYNGTVAIYSESDPQPGCVGGANFVARLTAAPSGVTQVLFLGRLLGSSGAPWYVAAGCRRDSRIFLWDARQLHQPVSVLHRRVENYQRFQFDVEPFGRYLFTGSQTGAVCIYDLQTCLTAEKHFPIGDFPMNSPHCSGAWRAHADCAHGLSVHPSLPVVATTSGQRRFPVPPRFQCHRRRVDGSEVGSAEVPYSSSSSSSEDDDAVITELTDDEASMLLPLRILPGETTHSEETQHQSYPLPLTGKLTRLPRENRLGIWSFPHLMTSNSVGCLDKGIA